MCTCACMYLLKIHLHAYMIIKLFVQDQTKLIFLLEQRGYINFDNMMCCSNFKYLFSYVSGRLEFPIEHCLNTPVL